MPRSTAIYGLDTSVFVRLLTGHPETDFQVTSKRLEMLFEREPTTELYVSNQVIGEAYITLQYHYQLNKQDAREGIRKLLEGSMVSPLNGSVVFDLLEDEFGAGLMDRLIVQDYQTKGLVVLTNDKRMAKLHGAELLN